MRMRVTHAVSLASPLVVESPDQQCGVCQENSMCVKSMLLAGYSTQCCAIHYLTVCYALGHAHLLGAQRSWIHSHVMCQPFSLGFPFPMCQ
jgi:hypothetical protein